jgi:hypothetical protein
MGAAALTTPAGDAADVAVRMRVDRASSFVCGYASAMCTSRDALPLREAALDEAPEEAECAAYANELDTSLAGRKSMAGGSGCL